MAEIPEELRERVLSLLLQDRTSAWLELSPDSRVARCGGDLEYFGLAALQPGVDALGHADFLVGLVPTHAEYLQIPLVQTESGRFANLHVATSSESTVVLVIDATPQVERMASLQQWGNDLQLDHEADSVRGDSETRERRGRARHLTAVAFRLLVDPADRQSECPQRVLGLRLEALRGIATAVASHAGFMHRHSVSESLALFGILPSDGDPAQQAVEAARDALDRVDALASLNCDTVTFRVRASAGIATGEAVLGNSPSGSRPVPAVFGVPIDRSLDLAFQADPGQVLDDESTIRP